MTAPVRGFVSDQDIDNVIARCVAHLAEMRRERDRLNRSLAPIRRRWQR